VSVRIESIHVGPLGENVYAVQSGETAFLIDPGDEAERILNFLQDIEISPQLIVLTHGHLDHSSGLPKLLDQWRGRLPRIAIHGLDAPYLGTAGEATNRKLFEGLKAMPYFRYAWKNLPEPDMLLAEGDTIPGSDYTVLHTPGHSAGSICLFSPSDLILLSGDTLFRDGMGRTDGPDSDYRALRESLQRLSTLPPETKVYPGHGEATTIGREFGG
jgi:glyoxylase-like metal-dependent hydrolase (beta-lactamase superfamily II)